MRKSSLIAVVVGVASLLGTLGSATAQEDASVRVYNRSSYKVYNIYVSPTYKGRYGDRDLLGSKVLEPGYNILIDFDVRDAENECVLDVMAKGPGNRKWEKRMNVCKVDTWNIYD